MEQDVACSSGTLGGHFEAVRSLVDNPHVADEDRFAISNQSSTICMRVPIMQSLRWVSQHCHCVYVLRPVGTLSVSMFCLLPCTLLDPVTS